MKEDRRGPTTVTEISRQSGVMGVNPNAKTLEDEFAMHAMSGLLADGFDGSDEELFRASYRIAGNMLRERDKRNKPKTESGYAEGAGNVGL